MNSPGLAQIWGVLAFTTLLATRTLLERYRPPLRAILPLIVLFPAAVLLAGKWRGEVAPPPWRVLAGGVAGGIGIAVSQRVASTLKQTLKER